MNAIMYACISTDFEGVYSASRHWLFEEICPPWDIGIGGNLSTSGHQLDLILPPCGVGTCFSIWRIFGCVYVFGYLDLAFLSLYGHGLISSSVPIFY